MDTQFVDAFHGLTVNERKIAENTAKALVSSGAKDELLRQLFNCVIGRCKQSGLDHRAVFEQIRDHLQECLDGPRTPGEFYRLYGYNDDPLELE